MLESIKEEEEVMQPNLHEDLGRLGVDPSQVDTFFFFFTPVTGPRRSLRLELSNARVYEPQMVTLT